MAARAPCRRRHPRWGGILMISNDYRANLPAICADPQIEPQEMTFGDLTPSRHSSPRKHEAHICLTLTAFRTPGTKPISATPAHRRSSPG